MKEYLVNSNKKLHNFLLENEIKFEEAYIEITTFLDDNGEVEYCISTAIDDWELTSIDGHLISSGKLDDKLIDRAISSVNKFLKNFRN